MKWTNRTICAVLIQMACATSAHAEEPTADDLFKQAQGAFAAARVDEACRLLRRSDQAEPKLETLYYLGLYETAAGRFATAAVVFDSYLTRFRSADNASQALEEKAGHKEDVENRRVLVGKKIAKVKFVLKDDIPGMHLSRQSRYSGQVVTLVTGMFLPVDPGYHQITVSAPGRRDAHFRFFVRPAESLTLSVHMPESSSKGLSVMPHQPVEPVPNEMPDMNPGPSAQRITAYVTGGLGILGIATGAVLGGLAWNEKSTINDNCEGGYCNKAGDDAKDRASSYGTWSTITLIGGAVLLTTGIILYVTEPPRTRIGLNNRNHLTVGFATSPTAATLQGTFTW